MLADKHDIKHWSTNSGLHVDPFLAIIHINSIKLPQMPMGKLDSFFEQIFRLINPMRAACFMLQSGENSQRVVLREYNLMSGALIKEQSGRLSPN